MTNQSDAKQRSSLKVWIGVSIVVVLAIAATQFNQQLLQNALLWVKQLGPGGAIAFIGIYILTTILFVPGSLVTVSGSALFGVGLGTVCVFTGAIISAVAAFLIGRYFARDWLVKRMAANEKFWAIDTAVAKEGLKIVFLTRLSPIFPFALLNYAFGITQVSLKDYILGSIGILPGTVMYVYIGSLASNLATASSQPAIGPEAQQSQWFLRLVGLLATIAVTIYITRIAQKALDKRV